jgi:PAS domain S-box-containing protein
MLDNSQAVYYAKSLDGNYLFVNSRWRERTGIGDQAILGKTDLDFFPEYQQIWDELEKQVLETGEANTTEQLGKTTGKTYLATKFLLRDSDGVPYALCNSSIDISERVQAEKVLQQYVQRLEALRTIDQAIITAETPASIAQTALRHLDQLIPCFYANILAFDSDAGLAHLLAFHFDSQDNPPFRDTISLDVFQQNFHPDEVDIIEDFKKATQLAPAEKKLRDIGVCACIKVPLISQDSVIGSINLGFAEPGGLPDDQIEIIREVADQVAIALRQANLNEQIRQYADELELRIAERTAELEAANRHLQELSSVKDEFVSNVSHEFRTPITSLKLYHDLLLLQPDKSEDYIGTLKRETNRLEVLVEDLLTLSRLDQERVSFNLTECNLNETISTYLSDRALLAAKKGINLSFFGDPDLPNVKTDKNLIGQVLSILLTNATNYTPANNQVNVSTRTKQANGQRWIGFCIRDSGPGIQPNEIDKLFNRFYRGKAGQESGIPGTGLGLSIAQEIVTHHGGYIEVESEGIPGKGASFSVWLPG